MNKKNILILAPLGVLFSLNVFLAIGASAKGAEIVEVEGEIKQIQERNRELTEKLISESSLTEVAESVEELNLQTAREVVYLAEPDSFAKLP